MAPGHFVKLPVPMIFRTSINKTRYIVAEFSAKWIHVGFTVVWILFADLVSQYCISKAPSIWFVIFFRRTFQKSLVDRLFVRALEPVSCFVCYVVLICSMAMKMFFGVNEKHRLGTNFFSRLRSHNLSHRNCAFFQIMLMTLNNTLAFNCWSNFWDWTISFQDYLTPMLHT